MNSSSLLLIAAAGVAMYFLMIRPAKKKQEAQRKMQASIGVGTEVMTTSGIFGTIAAVTDEQLSLEIAPNVFMRILPAAVARVIDEPVVADSTPQAVEENPLD